MLQRARRDGVFIPWHYVCADYAVSGTLACRRGYTVAKMLVERRAETGVAWFIIDDLGRMNRNMLESLRLGELVEATQVRLIGASDGFDSSNQQSKIMLAMMSSFNEVFIDQLKAKVHRGQADTFKRGGIVQHPGFGYRLVDVLTPEGKPVLTRKGTIQKRVEIDPEAAEWIVRGAEMIVRDNRSPGAVAVVFNDNNVGGTRTWSSNRIRKLYARERLVGVEVFRKTKQIRDRDTGHVDVVQNDRSQWMTRECPEMRISRDELADAVKAKLNLGSMRFGKNAAELRRDGKDPGRRVDVYPTVLVRPVCGGCGKPMALSRSTGKYKSFVCLNSIHGGHGCRNKGNKSARIIDEAVLKAVSAQILDEGFITDLTAEVNIRLAEAARRPQDAAKKLEQEIASRQRQVCRLTERLEKVARRRRPRHHLRQGGGAEPAAGGQAGGAQGGAAAEPPAAGHERQGEGRRGGPHPAPGGSPIGRGPSGSGAAGPRGRRGDRVPEGRGTEAAGDGRQVHDRRNPGPCRARPRQGRRGR